MRLALLLWLLASVAQADASSRLAPTPDALHRERTAQLESRLTRLLTALPSVEHAELALSLPFPFAEPLDAPASPPSASVVLLGRAPREDVLRILQSAVPNLAAERVTLLERTASAPPEATSLVQIGPFRVHPSSAVSLRVWLSISLLANVVLAGIVLVRVRRT
ncbi:MAG TPA: hypothetical protein VFX59_05480 [Polyangiales bacterium]|nr:hypothetical protein [Polyangiales bacterium]